jgi:hypothetical protein
MKTDNNVLVTIKAARDRFRCHASHAVLRGGGLPVDRRHAAAPVRAQAPDTIKACYVNGSGTIYRTNAPNAPNECTRNTHVPMTWPGGKGDDYPRYLLADGVRGSTNGFAVTASDQNSIAVGYETVAGGSQSTAFGSHLAATGQSSTALGNHTTASRFAALATGNRTIASGEYSTAMGSYAATNGKLGAFVYGDASSSALVAAQVNNQFVVRAQHIWLGANSNVTYTQGRYIQVANGAYLSTGGTWTNSSDVNRKHHFQLVIGEDVLQKIAALPIRTWSYKDDHASVRHMGPTAQDFHRAFGLGDGDKSIATVDADGVALTAIQALEQRELQSTSGEIAQLRRDNAELRAALAELLQRLNTLEARR